MNDFIKRQQQMERYIQKTTNPMHKLFDIQRQLTQFAQYPSFPPYSYNPAITLHNYYDVSQKFLKFAHQQNDIIDKLCLSNFITKIPNTLALDLYDSVETINSTNSVHCQNNLATSTKDPKPLLYESACNLNYNFKQLLYILKNNKVIRSLTQYGTLIFKNIIDIFNTVSKLKRDKLIDLPTVPLSDDEIKQFEELNPSFPTSNNIDSQPKKKHLCKKVITVISSRILEYFFDELIISLMKWATHHLKIFINNPSLHEKLQTCLDAIKEFRSWFDNLQ